MDRQSQTINLLHGPERNATGKTFVCRESEKSWRNSFTYRTWLLVLCWIQWCESILRHLPSIIWKRKLFFCLLLYRNAPYWYKSTVILDVFHRAKCSKSRKCVNRAVYTVSSWHRWVIWSKVVRPKISSTVQRYSVHVYRTVKHCMPWSSSRIISNSVSVIRRCWMCTVVRKCKRSTIHLR